LIVVDLSHVGESLKWEIEELRFYGSIDKVITVAHEKNASSARSFLESSGLFECDRKLFIYGDDGRVGRNDELITALTAIVALPAAANNSFNPTPR
jgi:hypothetical protein